MKEKKTYTTLRNMFNLPKAKETNKSDECTWQTNDCIFLIHLIIKINERKQIRLKKNKIMR